MFWSALISHYAVTDTIVTSSGADLAVYGRLFLVLAWFNAFFCLKKSAFAPYFIVVVVSLFLAQVFSYTLLTLPTSDFSVYTSWRHGVGEAVSLMIITLACKFAKTPLAYRVFVVLSIAFANYQLDFRGMAGISLIIGALLILDDLKKRFTSASRYFVLSFGVVVSVIAALVVFDLVIESSNRAEVSNFVRLAMISDLLSEVFSLSYFGNRRKSTH